MIATLRLKLVTSVLKFCVESLGWEWHQEKPAVAIITDTQGLKWRVEILPWQ